VSPRGQGGNTGWIPTLAGLSWPTTGRWHGRRGAAESTRLGTVDVEEAPPGRRRVASGLLPWRGRWIARRLLCRARSPDRLARRCPRRLVVRAASPAVHFVDRHSIVRKITLRVPPREPVTPHDSRASATARAIPRIGGRNLDALERRSAWQRRQCGRPPSSRTARRQSTSLPPHLTCATRALGRLLPKPLL